MAVVVYAEGGSSWKSRVQPVPSGVARDGGTGLPFSYNHGPDMIPVPDSRGGTAPRAKSSRTLL